MSTPLLELLVDGPNEGPSTLVLAHGAGAAMDSPFMESIAEAVAGAGIRVVRFEFPYMRQRRATESVAGRTGRPSCSRAGAGRSRRLRAGGGC